MAQPLNRDTQSLHRIAALIFTIIALGHLLRLVYQIPVQAGLWTVPMWLSLLALVIAGWLAISFWKHA